MNSNSKTDATNLKRKTFSWKCRAMRENLTVVGLAVAALSGLLIGLYLTAPLELFIRLLVATVGLFAMLSYPWALLYIMTKLKEEEEQKKKDALLSQYRKKKKDALLSQLLSQYRN